MQFENATTTAFRENIPEADFVDPRREHEADAAKIFNVPAKKKFPSDREPKRVATGLRPRNI
jgi:hypothetical protein